MEGKHLDQAGLAILKSAGIELGELGPTLNHVKVRVRPHGVVYLFVCTFRIGSTQFQNL